MATDFFDRQDNARRQTFRLLVMFTLSVVVIILLLYLVLAVVLEGYSQSRPHTPPPSSTTRPGSRYPYAERPEGGRYPYAEQPARREFTAARLWNPVLLGWVTLGTVVVVGLGSLYKIAELAAGGEKVALLLGGRPIDPQTRDLAERRLLNVVEEMALASGVPVPPVYVLENEPGINAFAAGHQPADAVVAASRGCLNYLSREELQGVVGHEFSHILNGDMRLNIRLIGIVNGILVLAIIGYYLMRIAGTGNRRSSDDEKKDNTAIMFFIGLAMLVLGYLGVFLGKIIKAGISRQREYLADASAVQFTRSPGGIAGALKKIGGLSESSRILDAHAEEVSHMFFADAFAGSFLNLFATHPPLAERIRRLDPEFGGAFPEVQPLVEEGEAAAAEVPDRRHTPLEALGKVVLPGVGAALPGMGAAAGPAALPAVMALDAGDVTQHMGRPRTEHVDHARQIVAAIPPALAEAVREPFLARAIIYGLLLSDDAKTRGWQLGMLRRETEPLVVHQPRQTQEIVAALKEVPPQHRLPLVDLAMPALKRLSPQQYAQFRRAVEMLVKADGKLDLFEYCLQLVLFSYLDVHYGLKKPAAVRFRSINGLAGPVAAVLSSLAYAGQQGREAVQRAFQAGAEGLPIKAELMSASDCTFQRFDAAVTELAQAAPTVKRDLIAAMTRTIAADGKMTVDEGELLRAVAAALACPMPPLAVKGGGS